MAYGHLFHERFALRGSRRVPSVAPSDTISTSPEDCVNRCRDDETCRAYEAGAACHLWRDSAATTWTTTMYAGMREAAAPAGFATSSSEVVLWSGVSVSADVPSFASERSGHTSSGFFLHGGKLWLTRDFDPMEHVRKETATWKNGNWTRATELGRPQKCRGLPIPYVSRRVQALTRSDLLQAGYLTMLDYDLSIPNGKIILGDNSVFGSDIAYFGIPLGDLGDICYARPSNDDEPAAMEDEVVPSSPIQCYGYVVFTIVLHECEFHVLDMGTALAKDITWKDTILKGSTQDVLIFKGRASVWNPAVLLDIGSVYSKPIPGPKGRKVALSKKRKHEESWRVQVLYGILPQQVPWDDAASLVAGYSSRKAWKRVMAFSGDVDKAAIKASMSNAVIFLIATLVPRLATTRELRAYLAGLGWLVALGLSALYVWYMDRTWDQVIGGFAGCVIAFTFGVMRNAGTARITYGELAVAFLTILFLGLRNSCLDLQSYELLEMTIQMTCAVFSGVRTRSGRRLATTSLLILAYVNWASFGTGQIALEEESWIESYPITEIGKLARLQDLRSEAASFPVNRVQINLAWLKLIRPIMFLLFSSICSAHGDPYRKEPGKEPATYWMSTTLQAIRLRFISEVASEEYVDLEGFLANLFFAGAGPGDGAP